MHLPPASWIDRETNPSFFRHASLTSLRRIAIRYTLIVDSNPYQQTAKKWDLKNCPAG